MGKTIEIRLSDAQHAALIAAAEASGRHLFDHCRMMLMQNLTTPVQRTIKPKFAHGELSPTIVNVGSVDRNGVHPDNGQTYGRSPAMEALPDDARMSRIEDALSRLTEYVLGGQQPTEPQPPDLIDVDSLVSAQFAEAEAQGLTEYVPDEAEQQLASSGVRPLSRRPIPFSAHSAPRHLRELG